ncbi:SDR family oxidoreductase [Enterobacter cloacae]|uniref:SDR family oxidoreductase n=1 Tax=Enterobacter cloacae TaxID=550 RepID=UPI002FF9C458
MRQVYRVRNQRGRTIIITGANSGTGREASKRLAAAGADVIMAVRSESKGEEARRSICSEVPGASLEVRILDLSNLASVRAFSQQMLSEGRPVDLLVNNAGIMAPPERRISTDGFELQFATNFLGHFTLTNLLLPLLLESASPRVTTMTSSAAMTGKINFDDLQSEKSYKPIAGYAQSKLACLLFANQLARIAHERGWPLISTSAHPGHTRTNLQISGPNMGTGSHHRKLMFALVPSVSVVRATDSLLRAAVDPDVNQGEFYGPRFLLFGEPHLVKQPKSARRTDPVRLWQIAESLTGTTPPML